METFVKPIGKPAVTAEVNYESFSVSPMTPIIGAEIEGIALGEPLSQQQVKDLQQALLAHQVLFFRDQDMTMDQHKDLGRNFGSLHCHPAIPGPPGHPEILMLHSDEQRPNAASSWHSDVSCDEVPNLGSILYGKVIPPSGGDTCFASMYAAYEGLSDAMQRFLCGLTGIHESEHVYKKIKGSTANYPSAEHPLIRTHPETGRQALFVNGLFTTGIKELRKAEARNLLEFLVKHIQTPEYQVRFHWRPNSVAFWDNRCTQHRALADFFPQVRTMQRVTVNGTRPFYRP
ncbi:MAG: TauD/TfdA family dioxygenase [Pseudomonadales bacterium]|nr:TauD/TfdA family dioxygenase [Pseudomonadales bacterium]